MYKIYNVVNPMIHTVAIEVLVSMQGHFLHFSSIGLVPEIASRGERRYRNFYSRERRKTAGGKPSYTLENCQLTQIS